MKISQREAHRLKMRVAQLEAEKQTQRRGWNRDWPSSTVIRRITTDDVTYTAVDIARRLSHAVVVVPDTNNQLVFFASDI